MNVLFLVLIIALFAKPSLANTTRDISCLAKNIYFEARNQSIEGQKAVAFVVLNRVNSLSYPNSVCEVISQDRQFSWTRDGRSNQPKDLKSFKIATAMAIYVYNKYGKIKDPTKGAIMYHANYVQPYWSSYYKLSAIIGDHIFYVDK